MLNTTEVTGEHRTGVDWLRLASMSILSLPLARGKPSAAHPVDTHRAGPDAASRNKQLYRRSSVCANTANLQQNFFLRLRCLSGPSAITSTLDLCDRRSLIQPRSFLAAPSKEVCNMS